MDLPRRAERIHELVRERLIHPDLQVIYDYMAPPGTRDPWAHLPTSAEIAAERPNPCGWGTGMEDSAINGGAYLACLLDRLAVTGRPGHAEEARGIWEGLVRLGTAGSRPGFVCRSVLPDGVSHYPNTSVDQVTFFLYGLWRWAESAVATPAERRQAAQLAEAVCRRVESDGFELLREDGRPGLVGDIGAVRSDRSARVLQVFLTGYALTGDDHWRRVYHGLAEENDAARLRDLTRADQIEARATPYVLLQNTVALRVLHALEADPGRRTCYEESLRLQARAAEPSVSAFQAYDPGIHCDEYEVGGWRRGEDAPLHVPCIQAEFETVRCPCEAVVIQWLVRDAIRDDAGGLGDSLNSLGAITAELLAAYDMERIRGFSLIYAAWAYWLAVLQGGLPHHRSGATGQA